MKPHTPSCSELALPSALLIHIQLVRREKILQDSVKSTADGKRFFRLQTRLLLLALDRHCFNPVLICSSSNW
jgi:hypothetical protein